MSLSQTHNNEDLPYSESKNSRGERMALWAEEERRIACYRVQDIVFCDTPSSTDLYVRYRGLLLLACTPWHLPLHFVHLCLVKTLHIPYSLPRWLALRLGVCHLPEAASSPGGSTVPISSSLRACDCLDQSPTPHSSLQHPPLRHPPPTGELFEPLT